MNGLRNNITSEVNLPIFLEETILVDVSTTPGTFGNLDARIMLLHLAIVISVKEEREDTTSILDWTCLFGVGAAGACAVGNECLPKFIIFTIFPIQSL